MTNKNDRSHFKLEGFRDAKTEKQFANYGEPFTKKNIVAGSEDSKNSLSQLSKRVQASKSIASNLPAPDSPSQKSDRVENLLPAASRAYFGLAIFVVFNMLYNLVGHCFLSEYWLALPLQAYWSYWLFTLTRACEKGYKSGPIIGNVELLAICVLNFITTPLSNNYHFIRLLDPFFILWLITIAYVPFKLGAFLDKQKNKKSKRKPSTGKAIALGSVFLLSLMPLLSIPFPDLPINDALFQIFWFSSQCAWIGYVASALSLKFSNKQNIPVREKQVYAGRDVVIKYRAYPELERWIEEQKLGIERMGKGVRLLVMWIAGPITILFTTLFLSAWVPSFFSDQAVLAGAAGEATAADNMSFIFRLILAIVALTLVGITASLIKPTHIALGESGLRFLWRKRFLSIDGAYVRWVNLTNIFIEQQSNISSLSDSLLCLRDDRNRAVKIRLKAIDSYDDKELLLNSIQTWAPKVSKDAQVIESLQPPSDYSYTELWLQALSAPPKRERFKPLINGAMLKNDRYQILNSLGTGGQGFAYLAKEFATGQEVVLKEFILPVFVDISVRKSALKQFENEARILSQLQHGQIVHLLDFFVEDHRAYLVLEHIDGASIRTIVENNGPLNEENAKALANQMCDILFYLHSQIPPVVHRDFTPDNLILNTDGTLKLIDFNVAQNSESTATGTVVGKPAYLPPEQFRGVPTTQSDIYAMGATLHFLLTGSDPVPISVSHPAKENNAVSLSLDNIIARATDLDLISRYTDIAFLKADLEKILKA